jgi:hypothetical protein
MESFTKNASFMAIFVCLLADPAASFSSARFAVSSRRLQDRAVAAHKIGASAGLLLSQRCRKNALATAAATAGSESMQSIDDLKSNIEAAVLNTDAGNLQFPMRCYERFLMQLMLLKA